MKPSAFASLVVTLLLIACADDENTSNVPPDLRLEDVLGCWYRTDEYDCSIQCYDRSMEHWYQAVDNNTKDVFEYSGKYRLDHLQVIDRSVGISSKNMNSTDTIEGFTRYQRVGKYLYVLNDRYQLSTKYDPVPNLDSLPCGKPFVLFPKPANWTLF
jgi:hypothetical protein